jgi:hypothetical protein
MAMTATTKTRWRALFAIAALTIAHAAGAADADVSGTWIMTVATSAGSGTPTFVLAQKGNAITGSYKGQMGESPVTGTIQGDEVVLQYSVDAQGVPLTVKYTGKVAGNSMSGKVSLGQFGEGTFKGIKQ